jgi:phosphatidylserine decarboxylase
MKHAGKAQQAGLRLILIALVALVALLAASWLGKYVGNFVLGLSTGLLMLWILFGAFTLYFFRDPTANPPSGKGLILSPAHGTVDLIDTTTEDEFMGGECRRVSIFLNVFNVHVQQSPADARVAFMRHTPGQFLNAINADCAKFNENVLIGFEAADPRGAKIGVRLIAGLIARRIIPWISEGETVKRGERISMIQFGSRANVYFSKDAKVKVKLGDKVIGGETILAAFE